MRKCQENGEVEVASSLQRYFERADADYSGEGRRRGPVEIYRISRTARQGGRLTNQLSRRENAHQLPDVLTELQTAQSRCVTCAKV